jgi:hypothetical protein
MVERVRREVATDPQTLVSMPTYLPSDGVHLNFWGLISPSLSERAREKEKPLPTCVTFCSTAMSPSSSSERMARSAWTILTDRQLLGQCEVDLYRASGPGGQKRNKTDSAVRLRHLPSGLIVIAEESRSQHENKARALRRLRQRLYLHLREPFPPLERSLLDELSAQSWKVGGKDERFWPAVGLVLDALFQHEGRLADTATALGVTTGQLVGFLERDDKLWEEVNYLRLRFGHKQLRRD